MKIVRFLSIALTVMFFSCNERQQVLDLSGNWEVSLDSMNTFHEIQLPGTTDMAGLGEPNKLEPELRKPQLSHLTRKHSFIGQAWYKRAIEIPESMADKPLSLFLERVIWQSRLWIDGEKHSVEEESLATGHRYYLPKGLKAGKHEILLCIDNRKRYDISVNELAHAYTEDTQVKWNGVLGRMELKAESSVKLQQVAVFPDVVNKKVKVRTTLVRHSSDVKDAIVDVVIQTPGNKSLKMEKDLFVPMDKDTVIVEGAYSLEDNMMVWDEFNNNLYHLQVAAKYGNETDVKNTTFGMREISNKDGFLHINGKRTFLRGTLECCIFPLTGTPPTDAAGWEKVFTSAKAWGLNHIRFHSWCPPEEAFAQADKMGVYLQVELPLWSLSVGQNEEMNKFLYNEYRRIVEDYGNHPSFCLMSVGNELQPDFEFLNGFVKYMKSYDPRHLYTATTFTFEKGHGSRPEPEDDFFITQWTDKGWIRGQGVFEAESPNFNKDYRNAAEDMKVPLISHEIGQYAVYPNMKEIEKYTGTLDPLNYKAVKEDLTTKGLIDKADAYLQASGKLAALLYKEEIERAMKTPQFSGFQLLDLHDFPGQGTALVGLLDAFWDSKGVIEEDVFRQFCAPVVPLVRYDKAVYTNDEMLIAAVEIANYSDADIGGKEVEWSLCTETGQTVAEGILESRVLSQGGITEMGKLQAELKSVENASKLTLEVSVKDTPWKNTWSVWVYPSSLDLEKGEVVVTPELHVALTALNEGKKVLFSPKKETLNGLEGKFLPVFWSPVHFPKQAGTMGLLCHTEHDVFECFPTDMHTDWQWWNLVKNSRTLVVDSIKGITPIVEVVDNFTNNRKLTVLFEANCGKGRLMMSAMDLLSDNERLPEVRQLMHSILVYMNSDVFQPESMLKEKDLTSLCLEISRDIKTEATSVYQ